MSTQTIDEPEVEDRTDENTGDDGDKVFHYVRKNRIAESAVMGSMVEALCGEVFPVTRTPKPGSPVCEKCKEIYAQMKK